MPTSTLRFSGLRQYGLQSLVQPPSYRPNDVLISPLSWQAIGDDLLGLHSGGLGSNTYPATNRVLAYPFELADYFLVQKVWWMNGTTVGTNTADVGVYTEAGTTLLVAGGTSPTIAGANAIQEIDCTDTLLQPGRYWCAYVQNGTTATPTMIVQTIQSMRAAGTAQFAGAVPLGSTFTPAANANTSIPFCGIAGRTQVA